MICITSIDRNIIDHCIRESNLNDNLLQFFINIVENFKKNSHIRIADNSYAYTKKQLEKIALKTKNIKARTYILELIKLNNTSNIKIFLTSLASGLAVKSRYIDFILSYEKNEKNKSINIDDENFFRQVKKYENKISDNLISLDFETKEEEFNKEMQKIFLCSTNNFLLRTSLAKDTLPLIPDEDKEKTLIFSKITGNDYVHRFNKAIGSLYFYLNIIIKIKQERNFLSKNLPITLNIFSYILKDLSENFKKVEYDKNEAGRLLHRNLSTDKYLKKILKIYNISLNFTFYCLFEKSKKSKNVNRLVHMRRLFSSNGSFKIDHEDLSDIKIIELSEDKFDIQQEFDVFELSKGEYKENSSIYTTLIQNSENLDFIESKFP